jgi:hypothetical protein
MNLDNHMPKTIHENPNLPSARPAGSGKRDDLEQACIDLLNGDFWCDAGLRDRRIYNILVQRGLMTSNRSGQMREVSPNGKLSHGPANDQDYDRRNQTPDHH